MEHFRLLLIALLLSGVYGCASLKPPVFLQADYENAPVKTIGILELKGDNETKISETDLKKVEKIVTDKLQDRDYDTAIPFSYESVGLGTEKDLTKEMIIQICKKEKVEALLYSSISKYSDAFLGEHSLDMNFYLFKANGDSIWIDRADIDTNGLLGFLGFAAGVTAAVALQPDDGIVDSDTKLQFGLGAGILGGLLVEGISSPVKDAITYRFLTLPEGAGQGQRLR